MDPDFGWHLRAGEYFRVHGIPSHDVFTYTARSYRWIDHEWGNDIIVSFLYGFGGYALVTAVFAVVWACALLVADLRARLLTTIIAATALEPYAGVRPLAWSVLLLAVVVQVMGSGHRRARWSLPLVFAVWANLHAGFIAGLAVVAWHLLLHRRDRTLILQLLLSIGATLLNPYGLRLYAEIFRTLTDSSLHSQIAEWAMGTIPLPAITFALIWAGGYWTSLRRQPSKTMSVTPALLVSSLFATRNLPLFVVAAVKELDGYVGRGLRMLRQSASRPGRRLRLGAIAGSLTLVFIGGVALSAPWRWSRTAGYPVREVAYLRAHPCGGNLFNAYDYGGYLIWQLPNQPVYIDGRMPTWQPYMNEYESVVDRPARTYGAQFRRYNIRCALVEAGMSPLVHTLQGAHWRVAMRTGSSELLLAPSGSENTHKAHSG